MTHTRTTSFLIATSLLVTALPAGLMAEERLPWQKPGYGRDAPPTDRTPYAYRMPRDSADPYNPNTRPRPNTEPPRTKPRSAYSTPRPTQPAYRPPATEPRTSYPARRPATRYNDRPYAGYRQPPPHTPRYRDPPRSDRKHRQTYSRNEILDTGHKFFGTVSSGLARVVARLFKSAGAPNGYILGEEASGAFVAGLRYGEGVLYTKSAGRRRIYWQGPSVGYDFGGEGSRTMVLVYNMSFPSEMYQRFGGVQGSAYVVGGVGVQFLKHGDVTLAPIRSGVGLRLGASVGYLKYTRRPTWNPF